MLYLVSASGHLHNFGFLQSCSVYQMHEYVRKVKTLCTDTVLKAHIRICVLSFFILKCLPGWRNASPKEDVPHARRERDESAVGNK